MAVFVTVVNSVTSEVTGFYTEKIDVVTFLPGTAEDRSDAKTTVSVGNRTFVSVGEEAEKFFEFLKDKMGNPSVQP